jgi:hypothetical protein
MIALPRQETCQKIMAAAREQAWTNAQQVLGLPGRLKGESTYTRHWDLTAIAEVLDQALALLWGPAELTVWTRADLPHQFAIIRPGRTMRITDYVVADATTDQLIRLAQDAADLPGYQVIGARDQGIPAAWTVTCPAPDPDCARPQDESGSRAEAEAMASDHDRLHHGGRMTAEVAPVTQPTSPAPPPSPKDCSSPGGLRLVPAQAMAGDLS